jgi:phenylpropionate dioxygenase-like ring-hydroxylating dioxygenase large terminal subunit
MTAIDRRQLSLRRRAFWDPDVYAAERTRIFRKCWLFVGLESEIPTPGDYVTRRMAEDPVILCRDEESRIQVLLNTCRHRGAQLCSADAGNTSHFRCSYHGWTYNNAGQLRGVPEMREVYGKDFDRASNGLVAPPRVESFFGLIFANWDPDAEPLVNYLGDAAWYLKAIFGRTDKPLDVMGPPARNMVGTNWKVGAENYVGDGYHISTTHQLPIRMGVFGDPRAMDKIENRRAEPFHCVTTKNGHGIRVQQIPMQYDKPTFVGYPEELWPEFERNLDPDQQDLMTGLAVVHGTIFPNFSFIDVLQMPWGGAAAEPTAYTHIRLWSPVAVDRTELLAWGLVPPCAPESYRVSARRALIRTNHVSGNFDVDDLQNWTSMAESNAGQVAQDGVFNFEGGANLTPVGYRNWPGTVYGADHTEVNQRNMYEYWVTLMDWDDSRGAVRDSHAREGE